MAAAYLRHLAGEGVDVLSAGSEPADQVGPVAVEAMPDDIRSRVEALIAETLN